MRILLLLVLCNASVHGFVEFWKPSTWFRLWGRQQHYGDDGGGFGVTGRVFVTMLGYPSKCERRGVTHSCTLSLACWLVGGSSQPGCGSNPWIVSCCVTSKGYRVETKFHHSSNYQFSENYDEDEIQQTLESDGLLRFPLLRKRNDISKEECGLSADRMLLKRIIGGNEAKFGQFPWQAHLKIAAYQCGGVLVSRRFVVTAAHCIIRARLRDIMVYLGELDTQDTGNVAEFAPAELHRVRKKFVHPNFQFRLTQPDRYDVALLELITEAGHAFHIMPICLPKHDLILRGKTAVVAGWGKVKPTNELMGTNVLRSAMVPILDIKECASWHSIKQIEVELHEEMLCAGHEDGHQDACLGDSGGPLIVLEDGRWTLAGITSAGFGCGEPHQPGIYHAVPVTASWIQSIMNSN